MKTTKFFALAIAVLGFSVSSFAQNSASATATAGGTIITPIAITKANDMSFGTVVANANSAGSVKLNLSNAAPTYNTVMAFSGAAAVAPQTAKFNITGNVDFAYTVTLSALPTKVTHSDGSTTMNIGEWTSDITGTSTTGTGTLTGGSHTLEVGATLSIGINQKAGAYTSTPFQVTVNYN